MKLRLLVVGKSENSTKDIANWIAFDKGSCDFFERTYNLFNQKITLRVFPFWNDKKKNRPLGEGLIFICKAESELKVIEQKMDTYGKMPIKFILYDGVLPQPKFESIWSIKRIVKEEPTKFVEQFLSSVNKLNSLVTNAFVKFDKTNAGYLKVNDLQNVFKELNSNESIDAFSKLMKVLNYSEITIKHFLEWWITGQRNEVFIMHNTIRKLKKNAKLNNLIKLFYESTEPPKDLIEYAFEIKLNEVPKLGFSMHFSLMSKGQVLNSAIKEYSSIIKVHERELFVGVAFGSKDPKETGEKLKNLVNIITILGTSLNSIVASAMTNVDFIYGNDNSKALFCITPSVKGGSIVIPLLSAINSLTANINPDQLLEIALDFTMDLDKLANEPRALYDLFLDGLISKVNMKSTPKLKEKLHSILNFLFSSNFIAEDKWNLIRQILIYLSLWIHSAKGQMEFRVEKERRDEIKKNWSSHPVSIPFRDLKMIFTPQIEEIIKSVPLLNTLVDFLRNDVNSIDILISICGILGLRLSLHLPGLNEFLLF